MRIKEITVSNAVGLEKTLDLMNLIELENSLNHFFINFCQMFFSSIPVASIPRAVWNYVVKNFTYQDDPVDEKLTAPKYLLTTRAGDCDDFALFIKTVLTVFNIPSNYLLAGDENGFSHIVVILNDGTILDGTNNKFNFLDKTKYTKTAKVFL